jgi:hypothetical protein
MAKLMEFKGFTAQIMEAARLTGNEEHGLPSGSPISIFPVSAFKNHPKHWMEEDGCFVVPVKPNVGLWFDWTANDNLNTAIVPTVKGCNPITGLRTNGFALERYAKRCPKHDIEFKHERYCEECGYKWPVQNYIAAPNILWWDTWRAEGGTGRQFYFTEDMMKDIANHLIGKEDTVPAFGFAFYAQKTKRYPAFVPMDNLKWLGGGNPFGSPYIIGGYWTTFGPPQHETEYLRYTTCEGRDLITCGSSDAGVLRGDSSPNIMLCKNSSSAKLNFNNVAMYNCSVENPVGLRGDEDLKCAALEPESKPEQFTSIKEVAVGAGAKIKQDLLADNYEFDSWKEEPDAVMRIYFIFENEFQHWKSFGIRDYEGCVNSMLDGLPVG